MIAFKVSSSNQYLMHIKVTDAKDQYAEDGIEHERKTGNVPKSLPVNIERAIPNGPNHFN
jgi:hypothetical protein